MEKPFVDGIVGARPNMMKMAPLARAIAQRGAFRLRLIHTGQHYDERLSEVFFRELGLPAPDHNLRVGSGSQGAQTARVLEGYEQILLTGERPRGVIVVGDVTSTMACTLAAAKLQIPVAHVEAGLRSGDRAMPEEINRIVTDSLADLLFASEPEGLIHLAKEGHARSKIHLVGNIMMDTLYEQLPRARNARILDELGLQPRGYVYLTLHRPSNVDDPSILGRLLDFFADLAAEIPVLFAVHPRTRARLSASNFSIAPASSFHLVDPLSYVNNLKVIENAAAVFTDSGGLQEESSVLNIPCLTLRDTTERPITIELGSSELVGNDPERIRQAWRRVQSGSWKRAIPIPLWDGKTGERIVERLQQAWN